MFRSQTISVQIAVPSQEVYDFIAEPRNLPKWASNLGTLFVQVGERDWATDTPDGRLIFRYAKRNPYGILDHAVFREGETPFTTPMRVFGNAEGTEITYTLYQRPEMSDAAFASEAEWVQADFLALKSFLEAGR